MGQHRQISNHGATVACGPCDRRQRLFDALSACPVGSALGGLSALAFDGLPEGLDAPPQVIIPAHARRPNLAGVRISYSSQLGSSDLSPRGDPRRTAEARSLIDAAVWSRSPSVARAVLLRGLQEQLATPRELTAVLRTRGRCRHLGLIRATLADAESGVQVLPGQNLARLITRNRRPEPAGRAVAEQGEPRPAGHQVLRCPCRAVGRGPGGGAAVLARAVEVIAV